MNEKTSRHEPKAPVEETKVERRPTIMQRVTTIPTPSGVFSGWGPKAA